MSRTVSKINCYFCSHCFTVINIVVFLLLSLLCLIVDLFFLVRFCWFYSRYGRQIVLFQFGGCYFFLLGAVVLFLRLIGVLDVIFCCGFHLCSLASMFLFDVFWACVCFYLFFGFLFLPTVFCRCLNILLFCSVTFLVSDFQKPKTSEK